MKTRKLVLVSLLSVIPFPAFAQFIPGNEFQANTFTTNDQDGPAVTALKGDGFVITWSSNGQDGSNYGIFAQRYDSNGDPLGAEFQVNTYTSDNQQFPYAAALDDSGFLVVWDSRWQDGSWSGAYGQRYNTSGSPVGPEFQVNSQTSGDQHPMAAAAMFDAMGNYDGFVVLLNKETGPSGIHNVFARRYDVNGDPIGSAFQVNATYGGQERGISVTAFPNGGYFVTWGGNGPGDGTGIFGQLFDVNDDPVGAEFRINTFTSNEQASPDIARLQDGSFVIVWQSEGQDGSSNGIYAQLYDSNGDTLGTEFQVNAYTSDDQISPSVTSLLEGGFVIVWQSEGQDGSGKGVYGQLFDASGNKVGAEFLINSNTLGDQSFSWPNRNIATLATGDFIVVWQSDGQDGDGKAIFAKIYTIVTSSSISLSIDTSSAFASDTILVPVNVQFPVDSTYSSAEISISGYQAGLSFIEVDTDSSLTGDAGWSYAVNETDSLLITWSAGAQDISGSGAFCWLKFTAIGDICTFVPITIESALFNTGENPVTTTDGGIYINPIPVYGDVDENGMIQAYDASLILKDLVGIDTLDCQAFANANVSLDTTVSALDASLILQYGVGLIDTLPYDTSMGSLLGSGDIQIDEDNIQIEQTVEIPLYLSNGDNILSFEGLVTFNPEHLTFDEIYWTELFQGFTIEINDNYGKIKFAGANTFPDGEEGTLAKLRFTNNMNWTETTIILDNLRWNEEPIMDNVASVTLSFVGVSQSEPGIPTEFSLSQNYPNPFNPVTTISYELPKSAMVSLSIYNIEGQLVDELVNERKNAGYYSVLWNASGVGSGVYFYRIEAGEYIETKKCLILK